MDSTGARDVSLQSATDFFGDETDIEAIQEIFMSFQRLMSFYKCAIMEIETKFRVLDEQFSTMHERNPIDNIRTRLKSVQSIRDKLIRKDLPMTIGSIEENLNDVAGVRVICPFIDDVYFLANCLIGQDDITLIKMKDYIQNPKPNGYRSLHLIVEVPIFLQEEKRYMKVEVQLRTIAMESWANLEHRLRYKKDLDEDTMREISEALNDCARLSDVLDKKMQAAKNIIET
ncbi:MAG: GTP pyrophosphokinase family protein [Firmicutes bacterium]|nr:GTP pyrophosphokinase family protein [Bacillota bacterium]